MSSPSGLNYADFADRVGTTFQLHLPDADPAPLMLIECRADGPGAFSLVFKAGPNAPIDQAIYELTADDFGPEPMFLVPVAQRWNDPQFPLEYQAIFNCPPVHRPEEEVR